MHIHTKFQANLAGQKWEKSIFSTILNFVIFPKSDNFDESIFMEFGTLIEQKVPW